MDGVERELEPGRTCQVICHLVMLSTGGLMVMPPPTPMTFLGLWKDESKRPQMLVFEDHDGSRYWVERADIVHIQLL